MTTKIRRVARQLSKPLVLFAVAIFAAGVLFGLVTYLDRSPVRQKYIPGTSAYWQQIAVAALACALFGYGRWRHRRKPGRAGDRLWLLAPLGKPAARRVARTLGALRHGPGAAGRVLLALPPALLFLYGFARGGEQVTGGLDPNFTVNAWGGPSYLGAMTCHYLDLCLLMAAAAWLLGRILLPDPVSGHDAAAAGSAVPGEPLRDDGMSPAVGHSHGFVRGRP